MGFYSPNVGKEKMKSHEEQLFDVEPGSTVLMYNKTSIGLIIGKYKFSSLNCVNEYEYHIMWAFPSGKISSLMTSNLKFWIRDVIVK